MAVTILEALESAEYNYRQPFGVVGKMAQDQLRNAIVLLEAGNDPTDDMTDELLEQAESLKRNRKWQ